MAGHKSSYRYVCNECGHASTKWLGQCPGCNSWHTMVEELCEKAVPRRRDSQGFSSPARPLANVSEDLDGDRLTTDIREFDRVLGGGLIPGGLVLLGGEPGIGKSTILLQVLRNLAAKGLKVLYASGEESPSQIRMRGRRLGSIPESLWVAGESDVTMLIRHVEQIEPAVLAVDSVQTLSWGGIASAPGSVAQIRESTARLMQIAKNRALPTILVGHVTKDGTIAGPRVLEHLVDTVLYFEGDRSHVFRIMRAVKNRYGPAHEVGVFEMTGAGLREVPTPSELFLRERDLTVPGSVIFPFMEGSRPILVEIQALVSPSHLSMPRRTSTGIEGGRLALLIAVVERHLGVALYDREIFVNVVGGLKITEPAVDMAVITAMASSLHGKPFAADTAVFGEVGLTGELRAVGRADLRLAEVGRLGLKSCIVPRAGRDRLKVPAGLNLIPAGRIEEAVEKLISAF